MCRFLLKDSYCIHCNDFTRRVFADRIGLDGKFMSETSDAPLLELPDELLACVLRDVDALIAVACVCKQLSTVLANNDSPWLWLQMLWHHAVR